MARLLSLPRRLAVLLFSFILSITQSVRAIPSAAFSRVYRPRSVQYQLRRGLVFRLARGEGSRRRFFRNHYALGATGIFPFVRVIPFAAGPAVPVPMLLPGVSSASVGAPPAGLLHASLGSLSGPQNRSMGTPPNLCGCCGCDSCGGCGSCASCASCSSCSCTSCGTSCGGSSCAGSCGVNNCGTNSCGTNCTTSCGLGFGGGSSCSNCLNCASCGSCMSCTSCVCTSCASCSGCGSCASCVG
jgi:hypothetical protein